MASEADLHKLMLLAEFMKGEPMRLSDEGAALLQEALKERHAEKAELAALRSQLAERDGIIGDVRDAVRATRCDLYAMCRHPANINHPEAFDANIPPGDVGAIRSAIVHVDNAHELLAALTRKD